MSSNFQLQQNIKKELKRANRSRIQWRMNEIQFRLIKGESDKDIMRTVLLSERNYYKYKQKLAKKLEEIQKKKNDTDICLEVQTLKHRMSQLYSILAERIKDPYTKTSDLSNLASTAESIAINILKLESASITSIKQSNTILENHIKTQLPSRSKYQLELPKIIYNNNIDGSGVLENEQSIIESKNSEIIYND